MIYVISLGGSLIVPQEIDAGFLKKFKNLIITRTRKGQKFLILAGGGRTCRIYQKGARQAANVSANGLDWIGIETNRLNAHLLSWIFGAKKYKPVYDYKTLPKKLPSEVTIASGGIKPGGSSDSASLKYAKKLGIKVIVNLTNVAGVFDKDPNKFKNAKLISDLTWPQFRQQFGTSRKPGQHKPFDPSAAKLAARLGIKVVIMNGRNMRNLQSFFSGKTFKGTVIG